MADLGNLAADFHERYGTIEMLHWALDLGVTGDEWSTVTLIMPEGWRKARLTAAFVYQRTSSTAVVLATGAAIRRVCWLKALFENQDVITHLIWSEQMHETFLTATIAGVGWQFSRTELAVANIEVKRGDLLQMSMPWVDGDTGSPTGDLAIELQFDGIEKF